MDLLLMKNFCENDIDCRRKQLLRHFGENFNPIECEMTCDNCTNKAKETSATETATITGTLSNNNQQQQQYEPLPNKTLHVKDLEKIQLTNHDIQW